MRRKIRSVTLDFFKRYKVNNGAITITDLLAVNKEQKKSIKIKAIFEKKGSEVAYIEDAISIKSTDARTCGERKSPGKAIRPEPT